MTYHLSSSYNVRINEAVPHAVRNLAGKPTNRERYFSRHHPKYTVHREGGLERSFGKVGVFETEPNSWHEAGISQYPVPPLVYPVEAGISRCGWYLQYKSVISPSFGGWKRPFPYFLIKYSTERGYNSHSMQS
jgi:hypothetical protein